MVPLIPCTGGVSESCSEVIDTSFEDTIEFMGPDSSALFGAGTYATKSHTSMMDEAEVCLEQGEQAADVHMLPLGEDL